MAFYVVPKKSHLNLQGSIMLENNSYFQSSPMYGLVQGTSDKECSLPQNP